MVTATAETASPAADIGLRASWRVAVRYRGIIAARLVVLRVEGDLRCLDHKPDLGASVQPEFNRGGGSDVWCQPAGAAHAHEGAIGLERFDPFGNDITGAALGGSAYTAAVADRWVSV